ncbi:hypothetical protein OHU27_08760 [Streptomyces nigra]|uniref:Uncharacterized protein n=1 Tax=Streptomyces nigra TaxID=1827580 RepID=A0ABZ1J6J3_9ACTN
MYAVRCAGLGCGGLGFAFGQEFPTRTGVLRGLAGEYGLGFAFGQEFPTRTTRADFVVGCGWPRWGEFAVGVLRFGGWEEERGGGRAGFVCGGGWARPGVIVVGGL